MRLPCGANYSPRDATAANTERPLFVCSAGLGPSRFLSRQGGRLTPAFGASQKWGYELGSAAARLRGRLDHVGVGWSGSRRLRRLGRLGLTQGSSGQSPPRLLPPALHLPHSCLQGRGEGACRMDPPGTSPAGAANLGSGCQKPWESFGSVLFQWEVGEMGRAQGSA